MPKSNKREESSFQQHQQTSASLFNAVNMLLRSILGNCLVTKPTQETLSDTTGKVTCQVGSGGHRRVTRKGKSSFLYLDGGR